MSDAFPGPGATIYRNEAGEVLGWDNDYGYEPEYDPDLGMGDDYDEGEDWCHRCGEAMGPADTWLWSALGRGSYVCAAHAGEEGIERDPYGGRKEDE